MGLLLFMEWDTHTRSLALRIENCKNARIADYPCNSKKELEAGEGQHQVARPTKQEYVEENKEFCLQQSESTRLRKTNLAVVDAVFSRT